MSEEEYLLAMTKAIQKKIRDLDEPLEKQSEHYLINVIKIFPRFCNDRSWRNNQVKLMEKLIYKYCIKDLFESNFSGKICQTNESFIKFLKDKVGS
ncbi:hypothetical protein OAK75_12145 [Bacteriovoracales bacterium]|nr:hypothetical protein [Bacteriovoracales bacterium]